MNEPALNSTESPEQIAALLVAGTARLEYVKSDEAWYASGVKRDPFVETEWHVGVNAVDGGTFGEWSIEFVRVQDERFARHRIFSDGMAAMAALPGYLPTMAAAGDDPASVEAALIALGFTDATPRVSPYA